MEEIKICTECKVEKYVEDFHKAKLGKFGRAAKCKECRSTQAQEFYLDNQERLSERNKEYGRKNPEKKRKQLKAYRDKNRNRFNENNREYRAKNKERVRKVTNEWEKQKRKEDPLYKLKKNLRSSIKYRLRSAGFKTNSRTCEILGANFKTILNHLNNNHYGFKFGDENLDIDHIIPVSFATTEEEMYRLNHYKNLQLLPSEYNQNIKRNNSFNKDHFEKWLQTNTI